MTYQEFLKHKTTIHVPTGITGTTDINSKLFDFQKDIVNWALRKGRACIFADCGLGKTFMQLEWAKNVAGNVIILAPLAVASQTVEEAKKLGLTIQYCRSQKQITERVIITNYEMMEHFDLSTFNGVVLDESSIIKHYEGKFRTAIIEGFRDTPFKLACTATPAPNDYMELGNHAEFVGSMSRTEMLSMFFVHDGGETSKWRLKGHATEDFWRWVCSWAVMIRKPSDLGYEDGDFNLPECNIEQITVDSKNGGDFLFAMEAQTLQERIGARRASVGERAKKCADIVNFTKETCLIWCNLNSEADLLEKLIPDAKQCKGSQSVEQKTDLMSQFTNGSLRVLVSKVSISGYGMNWQHCHNVFFVGLSDSWEDYYQAVRRCWRFGQKNSVNVYLITSSAEGAVVANIKRKEADALAMAENMVLNMHEINKQEIHGMVQTKDNYKEALAEGERFKVYLGDCVEKTKEIETESIDFSVFSPPFESLYTYSASDRDMGNCKDSEEFAVHFKFLVKELFRVIKQGRLVSFHCMNLPTSKVRNGFIGIRDFRGELIRMFQDEGFIYASEVCIWKDPVTAMQRTKALGLLHKTIRKDSSMSRMGIADYLVTMRKPGVNEEFIAHSRDEFPVDLWQKYASPVWMDINPNDTLQHRSAREHNDERHICPLQLQVIERAMHLWTNPNDLVLSPFAGIGSEGYVALKMGRRFVGIELKESYWKQAKANCEAAVMAQESELLIK